MIAVELGVGRSGHRALNWTVLGTSAKWMRILSCESSSGIGYRCWWSTGAGLRGFCDGWSSSICEPFGRESYHDLASLVNRWLVGVEWLV